MDSNEAWKIVSETGTDFSNLTEEEIIMYEEALYHIFVEAHELCEMDDFYMWREDAKAGAFNLAFYYDKIGKYKLAVKYYEISEYFGCDFAGWRAEKIKELYMI